MKSSRGISVISVIVTVVIIIILSSITIFSGANMLNKARKSKAKERLEVIYEALVKDELSLGIGDTSEERVLQDDDYIKMGLDYYAKGDEMPEVTFSKRIGGVDNAADTTKRTYHLKTYIDTNKTKPYEIYKELNVTDTKYSTSVLFDPVAGVNRPQLTSDMKPVTFSKSEVGEYVEDVFNTNWYSYDSKAPNYANMEIEVTSNGHQIKKTYVWIPRYAYKIQDYYKENVLPNVPPTAIDIKFLKGTSNLDVDGNSLPNGYIVPLAFTFGDMALAGIWVEKYTTETSSTISNVFNEALDVYKKENVATSHLLKNSEWAAFAYLAQACGAAKSCESTTNNLSGICDINSGEKEYIAAHIIDSNSNALKNNGSVLKDAENKYVDRFTTAGNWGSLNSTNPTSYADALVETSTGEGAKSAWYNSQTTQPNSEKPFIIRGTNDSLFGFSSSDGHENIAHYRTTIIIETIGETVLVIGDADSRYVKVTGDTYLYEPATSGFNSDCTYYVTWNAEGKETAVPLSNGAPSNWYNYTEQRWANILVKGNSNKAYMVWIPRYVYKLNSANETSEVRFVDINNKYKDPNGKLEQITIGTGENDWRIPEAFNWDGTPIQGYWLSKYQVSLADNFYVERLFNKIVVKSIDAAEARLGSGTYKYYKGSLLVGTAEAGETFTYTNLAPNSTYLIRIVGSNGESIERYVSTLKEMPKIDVTTPEQPDLTGFNKSNTYYVTWDSNGKETLTSITSAAPSNWYNYSQKRWANIMVQSSVGKSYFVWIPRYKYQLDYADKEYNDFISGDTHVGYSKVKFISASVGTAGGGADSDGYIVPQAFAFNGKELSGYWMSKYQVSMMDAFYVSRGIDSITVKSLNEGAKIALGTGTTYTYYLNGTKKGTAASDKEFKFANLSENTTYTIRVESTNGNYIEREIKTIKGELPRIADTTSSLEAPVLTGFEESKTYYVTWDASGNETLTPITESAPSNWYDYTNRKWANILVMNGTNKAYFVWIPRYKYQLNDQDPFNDGTYIAGGDSILGYANVKFISASTGTAGTKGTDGYIIPQAFSFAGNELPGYWMSKYQVSAAE